jgi:sugar phosphate isomerase/epimerase
VREIGERITTIHLHDSKPGQPRTLWVPFGEGANPVREVLRLMQKERFGSVAMIERIYDLRTPGDNVAELRKGLAFCQAALDG